MAISRRDRWFKRHFPTLTHGHLQKLLRTGQVRLDGKRAQASDRVRPGQTVRVPPLGNLAPSRGTAPAPPRPEEAKALQDAVLYRDADLIALNKPAGLAVQGGTGVDRHLDGLLDALRFDAAERPRLVHRLDRDTSGVLGPGAERARRRQLAAAFSRQDHPQDLLGRRRGPAEAARGQDRSAARQAAGPSRRARHAR